MQPAGRWHGEGEGPVQYFADTPDGAWAEFIRHEEITDPADLVGVARSLWAVDIDLEAEDLGEPNLPRATLLGGLGSYAACQDESRRLRVQGTTALEAPSAALIEHGARGFVVRGELVEGPEQSGTVLVLFGPRPDARGWQCVDEGAPPERVAGLVRALTP